MTAQPSASTPAHPAATTCLTASTKSSPAAHVTGAAEVTEPGDRRGHGRPADRQALVGLDRVEALGERRTPRGGRSPRRRAAGRRARPSYGRGPSECDVRQGLEAGSRLGRQRARPDQHDREVGNLTGEALDQSDVETVLVQGADVHRHRAGGEVGRAEAGAG